MEPGKRCVALTKRGARCKKRVAPWPLCGLHWRVTECRYASGWISRAFTRRGVFQLHTEPPTREEIVGHLLVGSSRIHTYVYLREDPEKGRAWAWRCALVGEYPALAAAVDGGFSEWADVQPLLIGTEATDVEKLYRDDALPSPAEYWGREGTEPVNDFETDWRR